MVISAPPRTPPGQGLWALLVGLLLALVSATALASDLTASVDRTQVGQGESLTLTLRYEGQALGDPDFSDLSRDFEILSTQRQSHLSLGTGSNSSSTEWRLTLMPRGPGQRVIPSFRFKGEISDAFAITVSDTPPKVDGRQPLFVETERDRDTAHEGEQVLLTLRLHSALPLASLGAPELEVAGARVVRVHENQYQRTVEGVNYTVVEITYALFAEKPGRLAIPALRFSGEVPDRRDPFGTFGGSLFSQGRKPVTVSSSPRVLDVEPRPSHIPAEAWLPSKGLSIAQRWSREPDQWVVGEPVTRSLIISAQGLEGSRLPSLQPAAGDGYKVYPDQPRVEDDTSATGVIGTRIESVAIVPTRPGTLTLPEVRLSWWDTVSGKTRETRLAPVTVEVAAAPSSPDTVPPAAPSGAGPADTAAPSAGVSPWIPWLALSNLISLVLAVLFAILWWRRRPGDLTAAPGVDSGASAADSQAEQAAFHRVRDCPKGQLAELRAAILQWARLHGGNHQLKTLDDVVTLTGEKALARHFSDLDNHLYGGRAGAPDQAAIVELLARARQRRQTRADNSVLPPLYPAARD